MNKLKIIFIGLVSVLLLSVGYFKYKNMNINDIGLKLLSWVKSIKGDAVDIGQLDKVETTMVNHQDWTTLLQKYVTPEGQVNYQGFKQDSTALEQYLTQLSEHPPGKNWDDSAKLAYWINTYNAFTVKLILEHYPLKSIKGIGNGMTMINSPWDIKFFKIGNIDFDLNTIEHEILRKQFAEPRIHFAINCASFSCPKLRNEAFLAEKIEKQLEEQTSSFLNNPAKNSITTSETKLSKIFDWFQSDFTKETTLNSFIKKYAPAINNDNSIDFLEYNWALNE